MWQIPRDAANNPLHSTDAGFKMLPVRCKQEIQGQNALKTMQIAYFSSDMMQILWEEEMSANNAQSTDS